MRPLLYFTENVSLEGKRYIFSFREISVWKGKKFSVATFKDNQSVIFEIIVDKNDNWKIAKPAPDWLAKVENKLFDILSAHVI